MKKIISVLLAVMISAASFAVTADAAGWKKTKSGYVYVYNSGNIAEPGFLKIAQKTYYIQPNGVRKTGWLKMRDGTKYYFDKNGVMAKNKRINFSDGSYYFKSDGKMAADYCLKIGKNFYYYDNDGRLSNEAVLGFGMKLEDFIAVTDETYYGEGFDTDEVYGYNTYVLGVPMDTEYCVFTKAATGYYDDMYEFTNGELTAYGYLFSEEYGELRAIAKYFEEKFDEPPVFDLGSTDACYWERDGYYLSIFHYEAERFCAVYSIDRPEMLD